MIYAGITPGAFVSNIMFNLQKIGIFSKYIEDPEEVDSFDLIVFSGGADINPKIYGEKNYASAYNEKRDEFEIAVWNKITQQKVLGICRGHQLVNALLGGKLIQDLIHPSYHNFTVINQHPLIKGLRNISSLHHQGVIKLGDGMIPILDYEGVSELAVSEDNRIITTQFHPEIMDETFWNNLRGIYNDM